MKRSVRLAISVICGIAAAIVALAYASSVRQEAAAAQQEALARYGGELVAVCVATRDIDPGDTFDEGNVAVEEWVASLLPPEAITSLGEVVGKVATSRVPRRAVLSPVYLETDSGGLEIPADKVAVCVACDPQHAVGGSLERGDTVDVYVSDAEIADRLLSARVLDTSSLAQGGGDLTWVTLAVDPERVSEVLAATSTGQVTLVIPGSDEALMASIGADEPPDAQGAADDAYPADADDGDDTDGAADDDEASAADGDRDAAGEAHKGASDEDASGDTEAEETEDGEGADESRGDGASDDRKRGDA